MTYRRQLWGVCIRVGLVVLAMFVAALLLLEYDYFRDDGPDGPVVAWALIGGGLVMLTVFLTPPCPSCRRNPMVKRLFSALPFPIMFNWVPPVACPHCGRDFKA